MKNRDHYEIMGNTTVILHDDTDFNKTIWVHDEDHGHSGNIYYKDELVAEIYSGLGEYYIVADPDTEIGAALVALSIIIESATEIFNKKTTMISIKGGK